MMDGLQIAIPRRMTYVRITVVCSMILSVLLSLQLWCGERYFPRTPVVADAMIPVSYEIALVILMLIFLTGSMFFTFHRLLLFLALAAGATLIYFDVNRLQPWFYIYGLMLTVFIFYNGRVDDSNRFTSYFIMLQVIFASGYFFCGLNQLNCAFIETEYSRIISPLTTLMSPRQFAFFVRMGVIVPYFFIFIGIGLTVSVTRYLAITIAIIVHVALLIFLSPSQNPDYAMWFSHFSFLVILLLLFSGKTKQRYFSPTLLLQRPLFYLVFVLCVVMPFFNRGGWPDFLSFNFHSGNNRKAEIVTSDRAYAYLPTEVGMYIKPSRGKYILNYEHWCLEELNASCFPDERVFENISRSLKRLSHGNVKEIKLSVLPRLPLLCNR
jgi:hypothetical protein